MAGGAGTSGRLDATHRAVLAALADTFAGAARPPAVEADDPTGFWARTASDLGVGERMADRLEQLLDAQGLTELEGLLAMLRSIGFPRLPQGAREGLVKTLSAVSADARTGFDGLKGLALQLHYGAVDADGRNPNWTELGYPGPPHIDPPARVLSTWQPPAGTEAIHLDAEVVVIGSGSGGGVIAGELAAAGVDVVVLEAGRHLEPADFPADELSALEAMYWRGGLTLTEEGNVAILAGATLGGGSTINWQNCVRPPELVRALWQEQYGLDGIAGAAFDDHLNAVLTRLGATDEATVLNGVNQHLADGADALGWSWSKAVRNTDASIDRPETAGHVGYGDRTGSKQGTLATYLADAAQVGTRIVCGARAQRITTEQGRATGVVGELTDGAGTTRPLTVSAPTVVVAAGALETPAMLLRSAIGGPAVGQHLRLHPVPMMTGVYGEDLRAWWGPPQATIVHEHREVVAGHGYLIETAHLHPAITAAAVPWTSSREHKLIMGRFANLGVFIAVTRDHGGGSVTIDATGEAVVHYPLTDDVDAQVRRHAVRAMVELHEAAGAKAILDTDRQRRMWRRGEPIEPFIADVEAAVSGAAGRVLFSAHQMGSARMGRDASTSVADPDGQLHDTPGVWIGDTSAFPTAVGSNPMLTCMALARRTAHAILAARTS